MPGRRVLALAMPGADALRRGYWQRYGATMLGLSRTAMLRLLDPVFGQPSLFGGERLIQALGDQPLVMQIKGGVLVATATEAAARAGLREGDVILAIANTEVTGVKEFEAVLAKADKNKSINVLYRRGEWAQYALIRPGR